MKIAFMKCGCIHLLLSLLILTPDAYAQVKSVYSTNAAYNALNAGTSGGATYVGNAGTEIKAVNSSPSLIYMGPLNKKWNINYGVPVQVSLDYAFLRGAMVNAYVDNPDVYTYGTPALQQAVDFLGWTEFAPMSSWAPVKCTVKFRFIPPVLGDTDDLKYDYRNNPSSAPERGTTTFWIR